MNILIVQTAKMGDMVCTTPLFRVAKQNIKDVHVFVMGNALNKELLAGNPYIDEYLVLPDTRTEVLKIVREKKIKFAAITSPNPDMLLALLRAGVRRIAVPKIVGGWSPYATKKYRLLSLLAARVPHRMGSYAPREYLRLLEPMGITNDDTRKELFFSSEAGARVSKILAQSGYNTQTDFLVGIAPGVGNQIKKWGGENFARVASALSERYGAVIVIIGGPGDRTEVTKMFGSLPPSVRRIDVSEKLSVEELKACVAELKLFISVDTGPVYIAEAFGVPTVDIVGPMDEREQPPRGPRHRVVLPLGRKEPVLHIMNAVLFDKEEARRQTESITPEMVVREAALLVEEQHLL